MVDLNLKNFKIWPEKKKVKVVFFGTTKFSLTCLNVLFNSKKIEIVGVVTKDDVKVGRHQKLTSPLIKVAAEKIKLKVWQTNNLSTLSKELLGLKAELAVVVDYGLLIPQTIIDIFPLGMINVHPSLLPKYRGPSPIQTAILNGDQQTGVTIMLLDNQMDTGPILSQQIVKINPDDTFGLLSTKLAKIGANLLLRTLLEYSSGGLVPENQNSRLATITKKLTRQDGQLNWQTTSKELIQQIRALNPWPGTWTEHNGQRLKIFEADIIGSPPVDLLKFKCADGKYLVPKIVQTEGSKKMTSEEYSRGIK